MCIIIHVHVQSQSALGGWSLQSLSLAIQCLVFDAMCDAEYRLSGQRGGCAGAGDCQTSGGPLQAALTGRTRHTLLYTAEQ